MIANSKILPSLPAVDLSRAKKFYHETLGLKIDWEDARGVMFESGDGSMLYIYKREPTKADHTAVVFQVEGIDSEVKELRRKGIKFEEYDIPGLGVKTVDGISTRRVGDYEAKSAWFKDTEGNILSLVQMSKVGVAPTASSA